MSYEDKFVLAEQRGESDAFSRIDETHPVDIFLGLESGQRSLMVVCPTQPPTPPALAAIAVDSRLRHDGKWALVLRLRRSELKPLFSRLVEDLDNATRQQPRDPGAVVIARIARWQRLFSQGAPGLLEDRVLKGLCAEINFLITEAIATVGVRAAVSAWYGPYDAPKDFAFDGVEVEIKAVHQQAREYCISSLEQLTDIGKSLFLWCRVVELADSAQSDPRSVLALIGQLRTVVASDPIASEQLEARLHAAGYEDRPEYGLRTVVFGPASCYRVSETFPRLRRPDVTPGIVACEYAISVGVLEPFKVHTWRPGATNAERT